MADEIKCCPFCGADAEAETQFGREWWIQCANLDCGASDGTTWSNEKDAAAHWSRRAAPSSPVADDGLPDLPKPRAKTIGGDFYTADQMRQVQREAYEAGAQATLKSTGTRMDTGFQAGAGFLKALQQAAPESRKDDT